ncbi:MAG: MoaD/ThiS family protein [Desulfurococcales archaeon]|nr:MoaD/ThiS family protein [Desulfurococcales archaeon]
MKVEIMFIQEYYQLAGKPRIIVDLPEGSSVKDALEKIPEEVKERVFDEDGSIRPPTDIIVNGRSIAFLDGLDTRLKDGDRIVVSPRPFFVI